MKSKSSLSQKSLIYKVKGGVILMQSKSKVKVIYKVKIQVRIRRSRIVKRWLPVPTDTGLTSGLTTLTQS